VEKKIVVNIEVWYNTYIFDSYLKNLFDFVLTGSPVFLTFCVKRFAFLCVLRVRFTFSVLTYCCNVVAYVLLYVCVVVIGRPHGPYCEHSLSIFKRVDTSLYW